MSNLYYPGIVPEEYNQAFYQEELEKLARVVAALEVPTVTLVPQAFEPTRPQEGMIAYADATNWNPGHGKGLYEYNSTGWTPLFSLVTGVVTTRVHVNNTTTETTLYTNTIPAGQLSLDEVIKLTVSGYYDTGAASDTWTLRVKLGGATLQTIVRSSANNATDFGWESVLTGTMQTIGVSGTLVDAVTLTDDNTVQLAPDATTHTIDTTVDNDLVVTVQWGAAKAGNDFHLDQGFLQAFH